MHKGVTVRLSTSQQLEQLFTTPLECKFQTRLKRWAVCARLLSTFPATQLEPRRRPRTSPRRVNFPDEWKATCLSPAPPFCGSLFPAAFALCRALNVTRRARAPALGHISLVALMVSGWWPGAVLNSETLRVGATAKTLKLIHIWFILGGSSKSITITFEETWNVCILN